MSTEPRSTVPRTNDKNEISHSTSPFDGESDDKETANLNMEGSVGDGSEEPIYATIDPDTKSSKKSLDSGIDGQNSILSRSPSQETVFDNSENLDLDKTLTRLSGELSNKLSNTSSTTLPSYMSAGDSKKSLLTNSESDINDDAILKNKKTNRFLPRAKYAMQQKGFIIFTATAIILSTSAALLYLQDKAKFIAFFTNSPKYITIPVIALAAVLAISPILFAIKQFRNTAEHKTQGKDADEILDNVLGCQPENKAIKSVRLEYSNNTHSNFVFNALESENDFMNIDKKVISKTSKIESVINNRPLFTALLTGVVAANIALPLLLYAEGGVNNVQKFYQNPLTNNIGLSLLIGSGVFALLIICSGVHYYRKTNCTNLIYSQEKIDPESVNKKFIEEIKQERTEVLGENHSKDAKRSSLTLEQVVVQSHNCKDVVYSVG
ncbi:hypothetical protein [Wolbachia endosymbiont (group A) of Barypeithes pellucidus]|uniref:hypothetical protein n=1 Tax=Wolbachia endosymbiont (group A) of Barypeithes pellucidus TaxID=3139322 RepID=UPI003CCA786A